MQANQVLLAVGLGLATGCLVVAVYFIIQYFHNRASRKSHKYSQVCADPSFRFRAIINQDIPKFSIPQRVPFQLQQPVSALERIDSFKKEQYQNGRTHLSPTVRSVDVRRKAEERGGINLECENHSPQSSPLQVITTAKTSPRKISPVKKISGGLPTPSPASQQRKVAVHKKKPNDNIGKLDFSLYYDHSFRLLQIFVTRGIKIASPENDTLPVVLVVATLTFEGTQLWEQRTRPACQSSDPQFNEKLAVHNIISAKLHASALHFQLYDERTKQLIGEVSYSLKGLPPNKLTNQVLPLVPLDLEDSEDSLEGSLVDPTYGLGQLLISLCHNPTDHKLNVKILSARRLQPFPNGKMNPFVKLDVTYCGRKLSSRSTKTVQHTLAPNFCETFVFDIHSDKLSQVTLIFKVKHRGKLRDASIGTVHLGYCVHVEGEYKHWEQAMEKPHLEIEQWHPIQEQFVN